MSWLGIYINASQKVEWLLTLIYEGFVDSVVRRHHVYKTVWNLFEGKVLVCHMKLKCKLHCLFEGGNFHYNCSMHWGH